jgi:hypothetical protein
MQPSWGSAILEYIHCDVDYLTPCEENTKPVKMCTNNSLQGRIFHFHLLAISLCFWSLHADAETRSPYTVMCIWNIHCPIFNPHHIFFKGFFLPSSTLNIFRTNVVFYSDHHGYSSSHSMSLRAPVQNHFFTLSFLQRFLPLYPLSIFDIYFFKHVSYNCF